MGILSDTEAALYHPTATVSPKFSHHMPNRYTTNLLSYNPQNWSTLLTYKSTMAADSFILFCGGPVLQLEWIPMPAAAAGAHDDCHYLAVLCKRDACEIILHSIGQEAQRSCMQIWMVKHLPSKSDAAKGGGDDDDAKPMPTLIYSVAYDHGPVLTWAFCPSGAFTQNRLALVAMPTRMGDVHVLALPQGIFDVDGGGAPMLRVDPVMVLAYRRRPNYQKGDQITKLAWSKVGWLFVANNCRSNSFL